MHPPFNRGRSVLVTVLTLILNAAAYYGLAVLLHAKHPDFVAFWVTASIFVHELGHALVMERYGIKTHMRFILIGAYVKPADGYLHVQNSLMSRQKSLIFLAGVMGNIAVIIAGFALWSLGALTLSDAQAIASLNGGLIMWNLIPVRIFDGGHFMNIFFESISEKEEPRYMRAAIVASVVGFLAICIGTHRIEFMPLVLLVSSIKSRSDHDDEHAFYSRKKLTVSDRFFWFAIWLGIFLIGAAFNYGMPKFSMKM